MAMDLVQQEQEKEVGSQHGQESAADPDLARYVDSQGRVSRTRSAVNVARRQWLPQIWPETKTVGRTASRLNTPVSKGPKFIQTQIQQDGTVGKG